ncbi:MAG: hypothetical protein IIA67_03675 [Planctomycetes bacterium]|nr:hypothetical protein [Planctomycetota bacterium]
MLLVFAVSLFLPAYEVGWFENSTLTVWGWLAAVMAPLIFVGMAIEAFGYPAPAGTAVVLLLVCVGQVGFLLYFAAQLRGHMFTFKLAHRLLILGNAAAWCWLVYFPIIYSSERESVLVGYYVWCASMMIAMNTTRIDTVRFLLLIGTITTFIAQFLVLRAVA